MLREQNVPALAEARRCLKVFKVLLGLLMQWELQQHFLMGMRCKKVVKVTKKMTFWFKD